MKNRLDISSTLGLSIVTLIAAIGAAACYIERAPSSASPVAPSPRPGGSLAVEIRHAVEYDVAVDGTYPANPATAAAYAFTAAAGATVGAIVDPAAPGTSVYVFGPVPAGGGLAEAPLYAQGLESQGLEAQAEVQLVTAGTYLIGVRSDAGPASGFTLRLTCAGDECREPCGPDLTCSAGARCEVIQCIRAPCPSYCAPDAPSPAPVDDAIGAEGDICGTRGVPPCGSGLFCDYPLSASCGEADAPGTCRAIATVCTREYAPVCGCEGRTYSNACSAAAAGAAVRSVGACGTASAPTTPAPTSPATPTTPAPTSPATPTTPAPTGGCMRSGCSGQLCVEVGSDIVSTCEWTAAYACYRSAQCARQPSGQCGWTETAALRSCLRNPPSE